MHVVDIFFSSIALAKMHHLYNAGQKRGAPDVYAKVLYGKDITQTVI